MNFLQKLIHGDKKIQRLEQAADDYKQVVQLLIRKEEERAMLNPKSNGLGEKGANPYER